MNENFAKIITMKRALAILLMAAALISLRLVRLNADPPLSFPNGFRAIEPFTDEAAKAFQARNRALFGVWNTNAKDEYRFWKVLSPVWCYPLMVWFKGFGVSYASLRLFSVFWFSLGMFLVYFSLRKSPGAAAPGFALFFYGVNFYLLLFSRLGLMETMLNSFLLLTFFLLVSSQKQKWIFPIALLAWLSAYFIKQNALLLSPMVMVGYFLVFSLPWRKKFWASPANWVSVLCAALCIWLLWHLWHEPVYRLYTVLNLRHGYGLPPAAGGLTLRPDMMKASMLYHLGWRGLWDNFFAYDPLAAVLAIFDLLLVIWLLVRRREVFGPEILAGVWLLSVQVLMLFSSARVVRFWLIQIPAMVILAGAGLARIQKLLAGRGKIKFTVAALLLFLSFEYNFHFWLDWQRNARCQVAENSARLESALAGKKAVVVGKWAGPLLLPSRHQYYYLKHIFNRKPEQLQSFGITHILLGDVPSLVRDKFELSNDPYQQSVRAAFPLAFERKKPVLTFPFYDGELTLYELEPASPGSP